MKRIQIYLPDNLEEDTRLFMKAEGLTAWAKAVIKLIYLGMDAYCNEHIKELSSNIKNLSKITEVQNDLINKLIISVETNFENLKKSHE